MCPGEAGAPPPEVPEEFADAYRTAFERALAEQDAAQGGGEADEDPDAAARGGYAGWVRPLLFGALAVVLVLGAYGVGRLLSGDDGSDGTDEPRPVERTSAGGRAQGERTPSTEPTGTSTTEQPVAAEVAEVTASCTADPGVDAAGRTVRYRPENVLDDDPSTAWRCDGRGVGEALTFALAEPSTVVEVGLVPGYAKTDPENGADRYAENNRITRVRWTVGDRTVEQTFSADPEDRSLRTMTITGTEASSVRVQVLATTRGPRNTTAISEIRLGVAG